MAFTESLKEKLLLWCDRRCCLCKKSMDLLVQVHHIVPQEDGGSDEEDNAMPLCFDCHGKVHLVSRSSATKFKPDELKKRRNQVYDDYTRHLVPTLIYGIQQKCDPPKASFYIAHTGNAPSVKTKVKLKIYLNGNPGENCNGEMYNGEQMWNLNPGIRVDGIFDILKDQVLAEIDVRVGVNVEIYDIYEHKHVLLPVAYVLPPESWEWYLDPIPVTDSVKAYKPKKCHRPIFCKDKLLENVGTVATISSAFCGSNDGRTSVYGLSQTLGPICLNKK